MSHLLLMLFHAGLVAVFFALLLRDRAGERVRMFVAIFASMVLGSLALAWILYPFPVQGVP
jgi:hypothetical protein